MKPQRDAYCFHSMKLPRHIVIIPDGNRRWAKNNGKLSFFGHKEGAETTKKILEKAVKLNISYLTFWGCSINNVTKRPLLETNFLFKVLEQYFKKATTDKTIHQTQVKINVLGRWEELFPEKTKNQIRKAMKATEKYDQFMLTFLLAYSGTDEMIEAVRKITNAKNKPPLIDGELIKNNLWTHNLPPVDLVIRTGGEPHWSAGLMMWDVAEAGLHFTKTLWPDFSTEEFESVIGIYGKTERRFGK